MQTVYRPYCQYVLVVSQFVEVSTAAWEVPSYLLFMLLVAGLGRVLHRLLRMCFAFRHRDQKLLDPHTLRLAPQAQILRLTA